MPSSLKVSAPALANGRVGVAYSASFSATGGTPPYSWSVKSGSLPAGLSLGATGVLQGTPGTPADHTALTVQAQDAGGRTGSAKAVLTIIPASISIAPSTAHLGVTTTQQTTLSVTTNDYAGVRWSINPAAGSIKPATSLSGANVTLTAPQAPGVYTVTATSTTDGSTAASITVGVTDLTGVYTYHNDLARSGTNTQEYLLTPASLSSGAFGKLFSCTVDGAIYTQPLWVANLTVGGTRHNVVFVATSHDSVYAFDADQSPCQTLWAATLLDAAHGATAGEVPLLSAGANAPVNGSNGDMSPQTGVTGTPVIDPASGTLFLVSKSMDTAMANFHQRLHALDLTTGKEKPGSPVTITATYPGTGDGGSTVSFNARTQLQRAGLALLNGTVYVVFASHEDGDIYYGWVLGYTYNGSSLKQTQVLNATPNVGNGGIWMSGAAPAADSAGNLYLLVGNGTFNANRAGPLAHNDYGDSLLQLAPGNLTIAQYFTPSDELAASQNDGDFGSGGAIVLDLPAGSAVTHLITGGGKDGDLYILNRDMLGGFGDKYAVQKLNLAGPVLSTPAFFGNQMYIAGLGTALQAYQLDPTTATFSLASSTALVSVYYGASATPAVSAQGGNNGIVWMIDTSNRCNISTNASPSNAGGPAILEAHDPGNVVNVLYSSATNSADTAGNAVRYMVPTIANGKVYVGTRGSGPAACSLTSSTGELDVYGLK
jgi:hypothetical protein